jgi:hypothetical protein
LLVAVVAVYYLLSNNPVREAAKEPAVSVDSVPESEFYQPKPIKLELMQETEQAKFNIATSSKNRIQVLKRDADGNITVYKIINSDSDIMTEY